MQNTEYEVRPIVGYEGKYSVSNAGEVFSHNYRHTGKTRKLKPGKDTHGYLYVGLCRDGKRKGYLIHLLVLRTFKPNHNNLLECDHIDGDRTNNHISNLRWATKKENNNNPITRKRRSVALAGRKRVFTTEWCNNLSKFGVSIKRVYAAIPRNELPSGLRGPISLKTFYYAIQNPTDGKYTQCKALVDQYRSIVE